jgi:hypothetical protein
MTAAWLLAGAASASAETTRYVSADGGGDCTQADPCALSVVSGVAQSGDIVQLGPGTYPGTGDVKFTSKVIVQGTMGARPVLNVSSLQLLAAGSSLRDVTVRGHGPTALIAVDSALDRVEVTPEAGTTTICELDGRTTVFNSACWDPAGGGANAIALDQWSAPLTPRDGAITLRGVTASSAGHALRAYTFDGTATAVDIAGTILAGSVEWGDASRDAWSNYTTDPSIAGIVNSFWSFRLASFGTLFSTGIRPAAGSPAIDAGVSYGVPDRDLDGVSRGSGAGADAGAYEWVPRAPAVTPALARSVSPTEVLLTGGVDPGGDFTKATWEWGPTTAYGSSVTSDAGHSTLMQNASMTVGGFVEGATYHVRLVASNAEGTVSSDDFVFTHADPRASSPSPAPTASPTATPAPPPAVKPKVTISLASNKRCRASRTQALRATIAKGGAIARVDVYVDKKRKLRVTKAAHLKKSIKVSKLPRGAYTLEVRVTTKDGRTVKASRKYRTCSSR